MFTFGHLQTSLHGSLLITFFLQLVTILVLIDACRMVMMACLFIFITFYLLSLNISSSFAFNALPSRLVEITFPSGAMRMTVGMPLTP